MALLDLSNELLFLIVDYLDSQADINAFMQINWRLYYLLNDLLYRYNFKHFGGRGILKAAADGALPTVQRFVADGFNVQYKSAYGAPRGRRWENGEPEKDCAFEHPILEAANYGRAEVVRYLLEEGSDPQFPDQHGETPLILASRNGFLPVVRVLTAAASTGADSILNVVSNSGKLPIEEAVSAGHVEVVRYFLSVSDNSSELASICLPDAAAKGEIELVGVLLYYRADINYSKVQEEWLGRDSTALSVATENGDTEMVRFLVDHGADVHCEDRFYSTPLKVAVAKGYRCIVALLLEHDSETDLGRCMISAITNGNEDLLNLLLAKYQPNPKKDRFNPLALAAKHGRMELVEMFLDKGLNEEEALYEAVVSSHADIVEFFLERGTNPDVPSTGESAVRAALVSKNETIIYALHCYGAHIDPWNLHYCRTLGLSGFESRDTLAEIFPLMPVQEEALHT
ncbi:ankyrin repeat-containing domain protein [Aspergillus egyptiacus]|nr:ankyrin repeat-containing domain protein [Aspergillus egyptiacus]